MEACGAPGGSRTKHFHKAGSTLRSSRAVPHPSTNRALRRLTSEVGRDPVRSTRYGRQRLLLCWHSVAAPAPAPPAAPRPIHACAVCRNTRTCGAELRPLHRLATDLSTVLAQDHFYSDFCGLPSILQTQAISMLMNIAALRCGKAFGSTKVDEQRTWCLV